MTLKVKIDSYDRRLIYELDKNSKISLAELSSKIRKSKQFILYRMSQLEESGVITGYNAIIDMSKLGYFSFRVYFKVQQMNFSEGKSFVDYIKHNFGQVWTITSMHGKWDYALFLGVKSIMEFHKIWDGIMLKYKPSIKSYNVAVYAPVYNFNRKFLLEGKLESIERIYGSGEKETIDELDWKIIEAYSSNVRRSCLELSKKLKVSADTIRARIKKLESRKIIVGYKLGLNLELLGYVGYRIDLQLKSTARNKEIFEFCKHHKNIYQINKSIGGADFEIEAIVTGLSHLLGLIDEIKTRFSDTVNDADYFGFSTFHILQYIPD